MINKKIYIPLIVVGVTAIAAALWGPMASNVEQAQYSVAKKAGDIEIRDYAPALVAETSVQGERLAAINEGFKIIADYIFGNNSAQDGIGMTAPVTQQHSEKIAMTAPVTQQADSGGWVVHFIMPSNYTLETLPKPNNDAVKIKQMPARRYAVIRFSGRPSQEDLDEKTGILRKYMQEKQLPGAADPVYAFFNPPFTLPFLRRNEVMIEVD